MLSFEPNKRHLRELLIYFLNLKKSAAEAHRLLVETYGEGALNERSCREWFQKSKYTLRCSVKTSIFGILCFLIPMNERT